MKLEGKIAVITGAGSGIGRATALKFAREGAKVVVAEYKEDRGQKTVEMIKEAGGEAMFVHTNVAKFEEVERAVNKAVEEYGSLDVMFNNAGTGVYKPLLEQEPEDYDVVVKVNQYGVYYGILAAGRNMRDLGVPGVIVNTASVFSFLASPELIGYHAAKGAVKMMTQAAALELAPFGIRVVAVAPGGVNTPLIQIYKDIGLEDRLANSQMRRRLQKPEEIADVVALLVTDEANAINGSVVMTDDGYAEFK
jgi:glucose 1-dehydrogenase